eukprot:Blabericola_migrator_1__2134@NODE_158_length_12591_cov_218_325775_g138_i0_p1_GENE_NODE_158_length_12591_cov_218_325775_g138_i0NODE_158_length_12591_cov_218_325775_g138_i0_p1_ORF_typecomplete_len1215_score231_45SpoIIE/PF07228_12/3_4e30PP2C_2/PF13672_6/7_2e03PP2C_2/PF13672_6/4_1e15AMPK1_CBM/PF16561_5/3_9e12PP2C/PF00481_21/2_8e05_NODE_158_length_12591_cov_218_325775_g138_i05914235
MGKPFVDEFAILDMGWKSWQDSKPVSDDISNDELEPKETSPSVWSGQGGDVCCSASSSSSSSSSIPCPSLPPHAMLLKRFLENSNNCDGMISDHTRKQLLSSLDFVSLEKPPLYACFTDQPAPLDTRALSLPIQKRSELSGSDTTLTSVGKETSPPSEESFNTRNHMLSRLVDQYKESGAASGVTPSGVASGVTPSGVIPSGVIPSGVIPSGDPHSPRLIASFQQQERLSLIKRLAEAGLPYRPRPVPALPPHKPSATQVFVNPNLLDFNVIHRRGGSASDGSGLLYAMPPPPRKLKFDVGWSHPALQSHASSGDFPSAPNVLGKPLQMRVLDLFEPPINNFHDLEGPKETNKLSHLILTWTTSPAYHVEVTGTFTDPPWKDRHELYWCKESRLHWVDLHEICPRLCGIQQFKFIVDGVWKCDPAYPICDDGSTYHHLNNVMVIFPHRLRVRLSHQKLMRRHSLSNSYTTDSKRNVCARGGRRQRVDEYPPTTQQALEFLTNEIDGICLDTTPPIDTSIDEERQQQSDTQDITSFDEDEQQQNSPTSSSEHNEQIMNSSLLRIPSWACRTLMDCACVSAHTTPAALSRNTSRAVLESRWRQAADGGSPVCQQSDSSKDEEDNKTPPPPPLITSNIKKPKSQWASWLKPPVIAGSGAADSQSCRPLMISGHTTTTNTPTIHKRWKRKSRPLKGQSYGDGSLVRCLSHHGGRQMETKSPLDGSTGTVLTDWPSWVTEHLHSPEVLLELLLPSNVMKMESQNLQLFPGWSMTPHPEKAATGGADAFYISPDFCCMALADGVGEWDDLGFSPRSFADELMQGVKAIWENKTHPIHKLIVRPSLIARELMKLACQNPKSYGSATCCIVIFDAKTQQLGICNLGDSGVSVMRRGKKYQMIEEFKTPELCHFFNCPYQVSHCPPPQVLAKVFGMTNVENGKGFVLPSEDSPKNAQCFDITVEEGDLLILASDGLWDNLWDFELQGLCNLALAPFEALILHDENLETGADEVARAILEAASYRSRDVKARTPFAKTYTTECGIPAFTGGKWDDITVVAAWVGRRASATIPAGTSVNTSADQETVAPPPSDPEESIDDKGDDDIFKCFFPTPARFPYEAVSDGHSDVDTDCDFAKEMDSFRKKKRRPPLRQTSAYSIQRRSNTDHTLSNSEAVKGGLTSPRQHIIRSTRRPLNRPSLHRRRHLKKTKVQLAAFYPNGAKYGEC